MQKMRQNQINEASATEFRNRILTLSRVTSATTFCARGHPDSLTADHTILQNGHKQKPRYWPFGLERTHPSLKTLARLLEVRYGAMSRTGRLTSMNAG